MSNNTKKSRIKFNLLSAIGMGMMSLASIAGFFEYTDHQAVAIFGRTTILPAQTVMATENLLNDDTTPINKEKEEVAPEYVSYSEIQRTASRASKY